MTSNLPLSTLLSQVLVAFTIEFDNEFEQRMPHRTTISTPREPAAPATPDREPLRRPWLVSLAMWANFMRFIGEEGVPLREVADLARLTNLAGLARWGYVTVAPDSSDSRPLPPRADWIVRPTRAGRSAQAVWGPLAAVIETRWRARFGEEEIGNLQGSLQTVRSQIGVALPHYLPVVGYGNGMLAELPRLHGRAPAIDEPITASRLDLSALLSQVLLAFTLEYERESALSLSISANVLRILDEDGVFVRDLPRRAGVSKEAISAAVGFLGRHGYLVVEPDPLAIRTKRARLTAKGLMAQQGHHRLLGDIEDRWRLRFGTDDIERLKGLLRDLIGQRDGRQPRMALGLRPYPDGWRAHNPYLAQTKAMVQDPGAALPHHPMVSHRGGFPDGS